MVAKGLITMSPMAGDAAAEEALVSSEDINKLDMLRRHSPGKGAPGVVGKVGAYRRQRQEVAPRGGSPTCGLGLGQRKQREGGAHGRLGKGPDS